MSARLIEGTANKLMAWLIRLIPRRLLLAAIDRRQTRRSAPKA